MADSFFESSPVFQNSQLKIRFMGMISELLCQHHKIDSLEEFDLVEHVINGKSLAQLHVSQVTLPVQIKASVSYNELKNYQFNKVPIVLSLKDTIESHLQSGQITMTPVKETADIMEIDIPFDKKDLEHYQAFLNTNQMIQHYDLAHVMILDIQPVSVENAFPLKLGIRHNGAEKSNLLHNEISKTLAKNAYHVLVNKYQLLQMDAPVPFLSKTECAHRDNMFKTYGPCHSLEDLMQGGISLPLKNSSDFPFADNLLLMPTQSLLVELLIFMVDVKLPILHIKIDPKKPSIYSIIPMFVVEQLLKHDVMADLSEHMKNIMNLSQLNFEIIPLEQAIQEQATSSLRTSQHLTFSEDDDMTNSNDEQVLTQLRPITLTYNITFLACQNKKVPFVTKTILPLDTNLFYMPSLDFVIENKSM